MGAPPPTRTAPMDTCTEERRVMLMGNAWAALTGAAIIRKPESVCSERVRRRPERRRRKFRPETLRHRNGRRRQGQPPRGLWRGGDPNCFPPPKGSGARGRLISQVTGQKGGRRLSRGVAPAAFFVWRFCGKTDPAFQAAPGAGRAHRGLRRLGHAGAVQLADRRAPRGAPRRRRVRRVAHVRGGAAWRARGRGGGGGGGGRSG